MLSRLACILIVGGLAAAAAGCGSSSSAKQATATAPGVTPCRSATGRSASARARLAERAGSVKSGWPPRQSPGSRLAARATVNAPVSSPEAIGL